MRRDPEIVGHAVRMPLTRHDPDWLLLRTVEGHPSGGLGFEPRIGFELEQTGSSHPYPAGAPERSNGYAECGNRGCDGCPPDRVRRNALVGCDVARPKDRAMPAFAARPDPPTRAVAPTSPRATPHPHVLSPRPRGRRHSDQRLRRP